MSLATLALAFACTSFGAALGAVAMGLLCGGKDQEVHSELAETRASLKACQVKLIAIGSMDTIESSPIARQMAMIARGTVPAPAVGALHA